MLKDILSVRICKIAMKENILYLKQSNEWLCQQTSRKDRLESSSAVFVPRNKN